MSKETKFMNVKERMQEIRYWVERGEIIITAMTLHQPEDKEEFENYINWLSRFLEQIKLLSSPEELKVKTIENIEGFWHEVN